MAQAYRDPSREADPHALPDIEVFHMTAQEAAWNTTAGTAAGWYWWACFPGCLPDCDPVGPFDTEAEALTRELGEWWHESRRSEPWRVQCEDCILGFKTENQAIAFVLKHFGAPASMLNPASGKRP